MNRPRSIVPPRSFVAHGLAAPVAGAAGPSLSNHGGPVIGSVEVVPIYWGAAWSDATNGPISTQLDSFFDFITTSSLMDLLAEYGTSSTPIGHGKRLQSVRITDSEPGSSTAAGSQVTDAQIQSALAAWIAAGTVPATTENTLYFVYLPPGVVVVDSNGDRSCSQLCGYHNNNGGVYYAVIPYVNCPGCVLPGDFLDTLTEVSSHELCEAITDPTLNTWWDDNTGNEIGDICNQDAARLGPYLVQTEWSNRQSSCAIAPAAGP